MIFTIGSAIRNFVIVSHRVPGSLYNEYIALSAIQQAHAGECTSTRNYFPRVQPARVERNTGDNKNYVI